jgi:hypothetical protein
MSKPHKTFGDAFKATGETAQAYTTAVGHQKAKGNMDRACAWLVRDMEKNSALLRAVAMNCLQIAAADMRGTIDDGQRSREAQKGIAVVASGADQSSVETQATGARPAPVQRPRTEGEREAAKSVARIEASVLDDFGFGKNIRMREIRALQQEGMDRLQRGFLRNLNEARNVGFLEMCLQHGVISDDTIMLRKWIAEPQLRKYAALATKQAPDVLRKAAENVALQMRRGAVQPQLEA